MSGEIVDGQKDVNGEIADTLSDAVRAADEAYGIACAEFGETDPRSRAILAAWAEAETVLRMFRPNGDGA